MISTPPILVNRPIPADLGSKGFCIVAGSDFLLANELKQSANNLWNSWNWLEPDRYLKSENIFRYRRYGRFEILSEKDPPIPQTESAYFQSLENNPYAGGIKREFSPLLPEVYKNIFLLSLIMHDFYQIKGVHGLGCKCVVGVHQMRVTASQGYCGHPTPEGIHRDGHDFNVIHFVGRKYIVGGESRIYNNEKSLLKASSLLNTLDSIYLNDRRVLHDVSPILQEMPGVNGYRDVMTINFEFF
ncbi:MAG: hypothetical protein RLZZ609_2303 [Cyanobacteriota bacterium]|jgi:hypothetical protein